MRLLAKYPDSLIARTKGPAAAEDVSGRARQLLKLPAAEFGLAVVQFDRWLRDASYNPGTTADLVTASLFVALRQNIIQLPLAKPG